MSLSVPNPALTNALTNVDARFCRAESTAGPVAARPSTRCILYTCRRARAGRWQLAPIAAVGCTPIHAPPCTTMRRYAPSHAY